MLHKCGKLADVFGFLKAIPVEKDDGLGESIAIDPCLLLRSSAPGREANLSLAICSFINRLTDSFVDTLTMNKLVVELLAFAPAPAQPGQEPPPFWVSMVPLLALMVMLYIVMIRPQQKKAREHNDLLSRLKVGDKIVTTSGIVGTVVSLKDKHVAVRSADTKLEILKSAISEVTEKNPS